MTVRRMHDGGTTLVVALVAALLVALPGLVVGPMVGGAGAREPGLGPSNSRRATAPG